MAAIAVMLVRASINYAVVLPLFAIVLPLALAISAGCQPRPDGQRSEEADRLLTFLGDAINAEPSRTM